MQLKRLFSFLLIATGFIASLSSCSGKYKQSYDLHRSFDGTYVSLAPDFHGNMLPMVLSRLSLVDIKSYKCFDSSKSNKIVLLDKKTRQMAFLENLLLSDVLNEQTISKAIDVVFDAVSSQPKRKEYSKLYIGQVFLRFSRLGNVRNKINYLYNNLFPFKVFTDKELEGIIFYLSQKVFLESRKNDDAKNALMLSEMNENEAKYVANAAKLGFLDCFIPKNGANELLVLGSSRKSFVKRVGFLKTHYCKEGDCSLLHKLYKDIIISSGRRSLYAQMDGLGDNSEESEQDGVSYILRLARYHKIKHAPDNIFVEEEIGGRKLIRFNDNGELRETLMCEDVYKSKIDGIYTVSDTDAPKGQSRPNTKDCVQNDAMIMVRNNIGKKVITVAALSNQPYILRQVQSIKAVMQKIVRNQKSPTFIITPLGSGIDWKNDEKVNLQILKTQISGTIYDAYELLADGSDPTMDRQKIRLAVLKSL